MGSGKTYWGKIWAEKHELPFFDLDEVIEKTEGRSVLDIFEKNGKAKKSNYRYQFWQHENHPILLDSAEKYWQRLLYLHENPVRAGFVYEPEHWMYSSAIDYYNGVQKGLLEISFLE